MKYLKSKIVYASLILAFLACHRGKKGVLPFYNTPDFSPIFLQNKNEINRKIKHQIANFSLTDQDGKTITQDDIEGKISIADFVFTSCTDICPKITQNIKTVSNRFKDDSNIVILSFSVTPWIDSMSVLKAYKKKKRIENKKWHFLTGAKSEIYTLARKSYFAGGELGFSKDSSNFFHSEHVLLIDKNKRIRGIYNGTLQVDIMQLIKDISILQKEQFN